MCLGFLTDLGHTVLDDSQQLTKDEEAGLYNATQSVLRRSHLHCLAEINALSMFFTTPYIGRADHSLVQYLTDLNHKFPTSIPDIPENIALSRRA